MPSTLYLDAARMGQMAPSAQWALHDFVRFAGEEGCTLYFERFLRDGFPSLPTVFQKRYPELRCWGGLLQLKTTLAKYVGLPMENHPLIAGRSTNLMKLAARLLSHGGTSVMLSDLTWPNYRRVLKQVARKANTRIEWLPIRADIIRRGISGAQLVDRLTQRYVASKCRGLFIAAVSHDGIRLPVAEIVRTIRQLDPTAMIVVDGSQALGQMPVGLSDTPCDFYFGGCHKWLGSHLPLGIGFCPNPATQPKIAALGATLLRRDGLDPLFAFLQSMEAGKERRFTETVNLYPLFSCRGALENQWIEGPIAGHYRRRLANAELTRRIARMTEWIPLIPCEDFRSASVLLQSAHAPLRNLTPIAMRERFHARGIALTCYNRGVIRLSMPGIPFSTNDAGLLIQALALVHQSPRPQHADGPLALSA